MDKNLFLVLTCPRGLEDVLAEEAAQITGKAAQARAGFVAVENAAAADVYRLNLWSRTASRVLWRVAEGSAADEDAVYRLARSVAWQEIFSVGKTFKVRVEARRTAFKSLNFLALKVKDAVCDVFRDVCGSRPSVDRRTADVPLVLFVEGTRAALFADTSGEALFKRGYRSETGDAPLRENLAAGLLRLAGYDGSQPFFDPMCGSGTIAVEAAWIAQNRAPGLLRRFAFENWENFQAALWQQLRSEAQDCLTVPPCPIFAADADGKMIQAALTNARAAAADNVIRFNKTRFDENTRAPAENGILLSNPPYGERLGELEQIRAQYPAFSGSLKKYFPGWTAGFISADLSMPRYLRLSPKRKYVLYNGKLPCCLFLFDMVAGSHRK